MRYRRHGNLLMPAPDLWIPRTTCNYLAVNNLIGFGVSGSGPYTLRAASGTQIAASAATATEYTFSTLDIGAAQSNRQVVACIAVADLNAQNISFSSVSFKPGGTGGITPTNIHSVTIDPGSHRVINGIFAATITEDTTLDIVVNTGNDARAAFCSIYVLEGGPIAAAFDTDEDTDDSDPQTGTVSVPAGGVVFGSWVVRSAFNGSGVWSNINGVELGQIEAGTDNRHHASAAEAYSTLQTDLAVQYNPDNSTISDQLTIFASIAP